MAHINLRLHEVEAWGGESEALPPGENYGFEIEEVKQEPSSKKGTPMLVLLCRVLEPESLLNRKIRHSFVVADNAKDGSRKRLKSLTDATQIQLDQQGGFDDQELIGRQFRGDVINEASEVPDVVTGQVVTKHYGRIQNERPYDAAYPDQPDQQGFVDQGQGAYQQEAPPQGYQQPPQQGWGQQGGYQQPPQQQAPQGGRPPAQPPRGPAPGQRPPQQGQGYVPNGQGPAPGRTVSRPAPTPLTRA